MAQFNCILKDNSETEIAIGSDNKFTGLPSRKQIKKIMATTTTQKLGFEEAGIDELIADPSGLLKKCGFVL